MSKVKGRTDPEPKRERGENWTHARMSMSEVAASLGITKQAVHLVEQRALRKLREGLGNFDAYRREEA
jgi:DNA-directed RNA polymerase sigma subunit (sigma70/sigma32)